MKDNIFEVIIGRGTLKWDALWRTIEWLASGEGGHGLESTFGAHLSRFCFGDEIPFAMKVEYFLDRDENGKQKWPDIALASPQIPQGTDIDPNITHFAVIDDLSVKSPNNSRKIQNLECYARLSSRRFPNAAKSIIAVTDSTDSSRFSSAIERMRKLESCSFELLPLPSIAQWIPDGSGSGVVRDFRRWAESFR